MDVRYVDADEVKDVLRRSRARVSGGHGWKWDDVVEKAHAAPEGQVVEVRIDGFADGGDRTKALRRLHSYAHYLRKRAEKLGRPVRVHVANGRIYVAKPAGGDEGEREAVTAEVTA